MSAGKKPLLNQALSSLSAALNHDDHMKYQQAQVHYIQMLEHSIAFLKQSQFSGGERRQVGNAQNEKNLLRYMRDSIERIEFIRGLESSSSSSSNANRSSSDLPVSPSVRSTSNSSGRGQVKVMTSGRNSDNYNASPLGRSNSGLGGSSPATPTTPGAHSKNELQRIRKQHEERQLRMMREQMLQTLAEKDQQKQYEQQKRAVSKFKNNIRSRNRKFRWRSRDRWTALIDQHFQYESMDPELMLNDKEWIEKLNAIRERLLQEMTFEVAMMTPKSVNSQRDDYDDSNVTNNQELANCITSHVRAILSATGKNDSKVHPLATIMHLFVREICKNYSTREDNVDIREMISNMLTDISAFTDKILSVLLLKYWHCDVIDSEMGEEIVLREVTRSIYLHGVYDVLFSMFNSIGEVANKNVALAVKCRTFNERGITMHHLGIEKRFRLDDSASTYEHIVHEFRRLETEQLLVDKIAVLSHCVTMISDTVQKYWRGKGIYPEEKLLMTSDDILPVFAFVVIRAELAEPVSHFSMIEELLQDFKSDGAFALATADTAWRYVLTLEWEELERQYSQSKV